MDVSFLRRLEDKSYDKRKASALELERIVREMVINQDWAKVETVLSQLHALSNHSNATNASRNGTIIGLAATAIALGDQAGRYMIDIVPAIIDGMYDPDTKMRYHACESIYNVAKAAKGEILIYFNDLFDATAKLAADPDPAVKNGADLLDRLIKDIVTDQAATYVSTTYNNPDYPQPHPSTSSHPDQPTQPERAFSLERFIPLLRERITVISPFTRNFLVGWLIILDSVPELALVEHLPAFLEGLLKFLADPTPEIRTATQNVLAQFLDEIARVAQIERAGRSREQTWTTNGGTEEDELDGRTTPQSRHFGLLDRQAFAMTEAESVEDGQEQGEEGDAFEGEGEGAEEGDELLEDYEDPEGSGEWLPGQGIKINHSAIIQILLNQLESPPIDAEVQSTCLRWLAEFLSFAESTMVPFLPRLIKVVFPSLAHPVPAIRAAANDTNYSLYNVIDSLPSPDTNSPPTSPALPSLGQVASLPGPSQATPNSSPPTSSVPFPSANGKLVKPEGGIVAGLSSRFESAVQIESEPTGSIRERPMSSYSGDDMSDAIDYGATVNALMLQLTAEHEATELAALEWLLMLHLKAPQRVMASDDPAADSSRNTSRQRQNGIQQHPESQSGLSMGVLLKLLSDPSEKVLRYNLQLLAQISTCAEEKYFPSFMMSLLSLFSTDRRLLETRGGLIIRQLCLSLNTERIYRTFAEILEKEEDLEFASIMIQHLNLILITSPEVGELRKRLRSLDSKDGQALFTVLYKCWSHNAVATFSLCLLAQAYEQACALLHIFADLDITVSMLVQIDKLVQLLESPVFTALRLQLLEPDRYPFLLKAMYGLLMLLPQSSAFVQLRNRLNAVSAFGYPGAIAPRSHSTVTSGATSSTIRAAGSGAGPGSALAGRRADEVRWTDLLGHFRQVQKRRSSAQHQNMSSDLLGGGTLPFPTNGSTAGATGSAFSTINPANSTASSRMGSGTFAVGGAGGTGSGIKSRRVTPGPGSALGSVRSGAAGGWKGSVGSVASVAGGGSSQLSQQQQQAGRPTSPVVAKKRIQSAPVRKN